MKEIKQVAVEKAEPAVKTRVLAAAVLVLVLVLALVMMLARAVVLAAEKAKELAVEKAMPLAAKAVQAVDLLLAQAECLAVRVSLVLFTLAFLTAHLIFLL